MTILDMSLDGALLIAVILLLRRLTLYRLPKWTFLLLWAVVLCRLLAPFTLPSQLSVYTGAARVVQLLEEAEEVHDPPSDTDIFAVIPPLTAPGTFCEDDRTVPSAPAPVPVPEAKPVSPLTAVYLAGVSLCGLFFVIAYGRGLRRFHNAEPVNCDFIAHWQEEHPALFPVAIRTCAAVNAPLVYGLVCPVVLLPENTDWSNEDQLTYVLTHEYVHIRRGDLFWKLLLTVTLCIHWFNPLVWLMYLRANQDLELACDEWVVRILGLDNRKGYAYSLLTAAESGFSPLCITYTSKHHMEERIRAIMKMKKKSVATILTAALLVGGITAVFATSKAAEPKNIDDLPQTVMTNTAPVEKDVPLTISDPSAPVDPESVPLETDTTNDGGHIQPATNESAKPVVTASESQELWKPTAPENRWNVPDGEIPKFTEFTVADFDDANELGKYLEATHGLYPGDYVSGRMNGVRYIVQITYQEKEMRERLPDGLYSVNSKGETYGTGTDSLVVGYDPDLILVQATNGERGYAIANDLSHGGYPGEINNPDDAMAYMEWRETQPGKIMTPVYDVNRDHIVGYFAIGNGSDMSPAEELEMVADQMRRNMGLSEEEIAKELEILKQSRGWD